MDAARQIDARDGVALFVGALLLLLLVGGVLQRPAPALGSAWYAPLSVLLTELVALLLPALWWSRLRQRPLGLGLGGRAPWQGAALLLGGALLGAAWFYLSASLIEPLCVRLIPSPPAEQALLKELLVPHSGLRPLPLDLLGYALAPALCEEALFRGAILAIFWVLLRRLWAGRWPALLAALVLTALLFGLYHLRPAKVLPTAFLGLGFGLPLLWQAAARARVTLWPCIAMHLTNNAMVILLVRAGHEDPPWPTLGQSGALHAVGAWRLMPALAVAMALAAGALLTLAERRAEGKRADDDDGARVLLLT